MPERALLAAVLALAVRDARNTRSPGRQAAALAWLNGPGGDNVCDWLDIDSNALRELLR